MRSVGITPSGMSGELDGQTAEADVEAPPETGGEGEAAPAAATPDQAVQ